MSPCIFKMNWLSKHEQLLSHSTNHKALQPKRLCSLKRLHSLKKLHSLICVRLCSLASEAFQPEGKHTCANTLIETAFRLNKQLCI
jgi:hypothetical protein